MSVAATPSAPVNASYDAPWKSNSMSAPDTGPAESVSFAAKCAVWLTTPVVALSGVNASEESSGRTSIRMSSNERTRFASPS